MSNQSIRLENSFIILGVDFPLIPDLLFSREFFLLNLAAQPVLSFKIGALLLLLHIFSSGIQSSLALGVVLFEPHRVEVFSFGRGSFRNVLILVEACFLGGFLEVLALAIIPIAKVGVVCADVIS